MQEEAGAIAKTHASRHRKLDLDDVQIQLAPEVLRSLSRIEALVHDSSHFDKDLLVNLQGLTSGKPIPVQMALTEVGLITRETMKHVHATGDKRAAEALSDLHNQLMGDPNPKPFAVLVSKGRAR